MQRKAKPVRFGTLTPQQDARVWHYMAQRTYLAATHHLPPAEYLWCTRVPGVGLVCGGTDGVAPFDPQPALGTRCPRKALRAYAAACQAYA